MPTEAQRRWVVSVTERTRHHRRSIRLRSYDYSQPGMYYVTLTIQDREEILGSLVGAIIQLTRLGEIVREEWLRTPIVRPEVMLDKFVIMPDHLHGIIVICEERNGVIRWGESPRPPSWRVTLRRDRP